MGVEPQTEDANGRMESIHPRIENRLHCRVKFPNKALRLFIIRFNDGFPFVIQTAIT